MAYWGQALSLGPNINLPMDPADTETVYKALQKALTLQDKSSAKEQALISALSKRYTSEALKDRKPLDEAYANAMEEVAKKFPEDAEVNTLYAEALMDLHPWDFWKNGKAQPWTSQPVEIIDKVVSKYPNHPGANHLNIHILEASPDPDKAAESADKLLDLVPGSGHLVHMPSHIYIRVGRYLDGVESNERAVKTDEEYIAQCKVQGVYPLFYYPHNYHFLLACSQMAGMSEKSMITAEALKKSIPVEMLNVPDFVTLQHWYTMPWYNMVRFGKWNEILQIEEPVDSLKYIKSKDILIPAILTTAHTDTNYLIESIKLKVENYLLKPINIDELLNSLYDVILPKIQEKEIKKNSNIIKTIGAITDSKQVEIIKYIFNNLDENNNFFGSYSEIMEQFSISKPTLIKLFKDLADKNILIKISHKTYQFDEKSLND